MFPFAESHSFLNCRFRVRRALGGVGPVKASIGQPLALGALQRQRSPLGIVDPKPRPAGVPEIEFVRIPLQVLFAAMLVNADHATLEDREISFDAVGRDIAPRIFASGVIYRLVFGEAFPDRDTLLRFVGMEFAFVGRVFKDERP